MSLSFLVIVFYHTILLFYFCYYFIFILFLLFQLGLSPSPRTFVQLKKNRTSYQASPKCLFSCWPFTHCTIYAGPTKQTQVHGPKSTSQARPVHMEPRVALLASFCQPFTQPPSLFGLSSRVCLLSQACSRQLQHLNCLELALACPQIKPRAPCPGRIHAFP